MKELLDPSIAAETVERINKLRSDTQPLWGKMNVGQMLLFPVIVPDVEAVTTVTVTVAVTAQPLLAVLV